MPEQTATVPSSAAPPPPILRIRPSRGWVRLDVAELWRYRELLAFLAWRDILVLYRQTVIGVAWAILQPVATMVVFTVVFGHFARMSSNGMPYAVMTFAAILPWQLFSAAVSASSSSVVGAAGMITKVYFPRLIIPVSSTLTGVLDFAISCVVLLLLMAGYGMPFRPHLLLLPAFALLGFLAALGAGLWLCALNVRYRDVRYAVPFLLRLGLFVCPVGYLTTVVPEKWRLLYSLNPMVGVIDGFRWAVLGPGFEPFWPGFWASVAAVAIVLVSGAHFFRATERTFADVI
jgi:lipopolysaccharide transport system permease protein